MQDPNKLLTKIVRRLRTIGTGTQLVEVKEAAWKLPESIGETLYCRSRAPKSWPPSFRRSNPT